MARKNLFLFPLLFLFALFASAHPSLKRAGSLQQITNFGSNPTNVGMYIYVPNKLAAKPGIIVAIHYW